MKRLTLICLFPLAILAWNYDDEFIDQGNPEAYGQGVEFARATFADRHVTVTHLGDEADLSRNYPVSAGSLIRSRVAAFSEIEFIDGTLMQIDGGSKVEFQAINEVYNAESLTVIKLHYGSLFFHVNEPSPDVERRIIRVDTEAGSAYIEASGVYQASFEVRRMKLKVYRGIAELSGYDDSSLIRSGEYATILGNYKPGRVRPFNSFSGDRFERWAYGRAPVGDSVSSQYVDSSLASYSSDLDEHGEWHYEPDIELNVWVPGVTSSWRPYYRGSWITVGNSLTWWSTDPFGWVTHHYGSWSWSTRWGWYWIPGRYYSPAWVAWTSYNSYVGWCPLGYWGRPYYYNRYHRPTVVINNHHHHWNYVETRHIHGRTTDHIRHDVGHRGTRRVTTRTVHLDRGTNARNVDVRRIITEPELNRRHASIRSSQRQTIKRVSGRDNERIRIKDRSTGTKSISRIRVDSRTTTRRGSDTHPVITERSRTSKGVDAQRKPQSIKERSTTTRTNTKPIDRTNTAPPKRTTTKPRSTTSQPTNRTTIKSTPRNTNKPTPTQTKPAPRNTKPTRTQSKPAPRNTTKPSTSTNPRRTVKTPTTRKPTTAPAPKPSNTSPPPKRNSTKPSRTAPQPRKPNRTTSYAPQRRQGVSPSQPKTRRYSPNKSRQNTYSRQPTYASKPKASSLQRSKPQPKATGYSSRAPRTSKPAPKQRSVRVQKPTKQRTTKATKPHPRRTSKPKATTRRSKPRD